MDPEEQQQVQRVEHERGVDHAVGIQLAQEAHAGDPPLLIGRLVGLQAQADVLHELAGGQGGWTKENARMRLCEQG